jgi:hypothetical protein
MNEYIKRRIRSPKTTKSPQRHTPGPFIPTDNDTFEFYIQTEDWVDNNAIWGLDNVYPLVFVDVRNTNILQGHLNLQASGYPARANNVTGCAQLCADYVDFYLDRILENNGKSLDRYSFQLQGYGCVGGNYPNLFTNPGDYIDSNPSPWITTGIATASTWTSGFVTLFKQELDTRGLPYPSRLDMDVECYPNMTGIVKLLADPRSTGVLVDGRYTLTQYRNLHGGLLPNGDAVPNDDPQSAYDWPYNWWGGSVSFAIMDYALYTACYRHFIRAFPNIKTSNFDLVCGTTGKMSLRDFRFHNQVWLQPDLYATDQGAVNYTRHFLDLLTASSEDLFGTYDNCISGYQITNTGVPDNVIREMFINKAGLQANSMYVANPNKKILIYHQHQVTGNYNFSDEYVPVPGGADVAIDSSLLLEQVVAYKNNHIKTVMIFEPGLSTEIHDSWYNAISYVNNSGVAQP